MEFYGRIEDGESVGSTVLIKLICPGKKLLDFALEVCKGKSDIKSIYLHVQTSNDDAIEFYKKFDFEVVDTIKGYYKRVNPPDCYVLEKKVNQ